MSTTVLPLEREPATRELALTPKHDALAPDIAALVERIVTNPDADVSKLSALLDVNERILDRNAKAAFDDAFSRMWPELPEIDEKGAIRNKDGSVKSRYARYEDIQAAVRPVLARFGFAMRHKTQFPPEKAGVIRVVGILSAFGHTEESEFEFTADKNDFRTAIQDQASTISYGKRYTTCDLLNIITRGVDNDGQSKPKEPDGFDEWWLSMSAVADNGTQELQKAFSQSKREFKEWATNHKRTEWAELKRKAGTK